MFKKNFIKICNDRGIPPTTVCQKIGLTAATFSKWTESSVPRKTTLFKLADFLNVSVEDLLADDPAKVTFVSYKSGEKPNFDLKEEKKRWKQHVINAGTAAEATGSAQLALLDGRNMRMVPLFETVSAGFGAYASSQIEDYMPVYFSNPSEAANTICIRVRGDSMYPMIDDRDIIQVHKQEQVDNGSIAVVLVDGDEGLVKKVIYGPDGLELQSINPMYPPMRFKGPETNRVRVVGLVTQVIKGVNGRKVDSVKISDNKKELLDNIDKMTSEELKEFNKIYNDYLKGKENK